MKLSRFAPFCMTLLLACAADPPPPCACAVADAAVADAPAPDTAPVDAGAADVVDAAADVAPVAVPKCAVPWLNLTASPETLVPLPLETTIAADSAGADLSASCAWAYGPPSVCTAGSGPGRVRKVGDGTCTVTCTLASGLCGRVDLVAKTQTVLYVVGGESSAFPPPPTAAADAARVSRLRVADAQWDETVAFLPEYRIQPALAAHGGGLYVVGGETGGDYTAVEFWDVFFPTCTEAIITPTQLKSAVGCRSARRLDLGTGLWQTPFAWPHPRVDPGFRQVGDRLYLFGGQRAKTVKTPPQPELLAWVDLATGTLTTPLTPVPKEIASLDAGLQWPPLRSGLQGELPLLVHARKTWLVSASGEVVAEKDLGWPCPEDRPAAVFTLDDALFVLPSAKAVGPQCPKCPQAGLGGAPGPWCPPWVLQGKTWTQGQPMPVAPVVEAPGAVYAFATGATWRLAGPKAAWQALAPPLPYARFGFAAVAVQQ